MIRSVAPAFLAALLGSCVAPAASPTPDPGRLRLITGTDAGGDPEPRR